ncbi:MAG: adenosylmethionine--8-amino-7-oxononanoate transaminase [Methylotenera sp. 24-45-7]|nr:MAG: adenosylmethionine--8-amino-7-oxononanoate transaminase [Mehylophilales bacterium 35-46-6]OYY84629.1 MAG: adenosylmethionine--8-amino-7-oxononanoate transaminase [Methylophilales bacterium 16-45-9]OYZ41803.1 MAG: adenosylmethionine--8-amino-7-oxononanoate transaminase [Methylotenera sp. 24-45-7]OZA10040.1 MAG: adenosylmethionine--8-amino-7-oxononanoate transaminase [Methylotenera sp. 17-45-7]OZA54192.1 MAG: adenosylmethionine--8-amino-7-oxononanoate transaminase [Methylophilales bacteri
MSNQELLTRSLQSVWHPCTQMKQHETYPLIPIQRGDGVWLYDTDGKKYLDTVSSWWVNLFGHNNPRIKNAIKQQLDTLEHVMLAGFTHEPVVALSEKLAQLTGLGHAFYASDGASATEIALKMSFHYWRNIGKPSKTKFISLQNSYHGETMGSLGVTDVAIFKDTYAPLLMQSALVPSPDFRLAETGESAEQFALRCADALEQHVAQHSSELAALIVEPLVQCAAGMGMYHPAYLKRAREICSRYEVHLIADEIAVGFGRTGTMFACEQAHITADFICLSKGITGGYLPLSAVLTSDKIYQAFYHDATVKGFLHSHSYTGNPLACSAALATLAIFETDAVLVNNRHKSAYVFDKMQVLTHLPIKHLRHQGMIFAFDAVTEDAQFSKRCYQAAIAQGLLLRPIGNTVYFMPPYTITESEIDLMVNTTYAVLKAIL